MLRPECVQPRWLYHGLALDLRWTCAGISVIRLNVAGAVGLADHFERT